MPKRVVDEQKQRTGVSPATAGQDSVGQIDGPGSEDAAGKKKPHITRKGKGTEPPAPLPAELESNPKLRGASPAWMKLYAAIHKEAKR
ncbi:hypothetical protein [Paenibacillus rigui]|uniref:Uncharacterized protein n=1 Tax=Paenibacillus rigui TaxID=554312 RepID=A0A229USZ6_9BACL|nr:hypothetical protein [Paenibacillus rigui]OXM86514.1 hypothetical protein CF651_10100 [Paenibacillus rigui]